MISKYLIDSQAKLSKAMTALDQVGGIGLIVVDEKNNLKGVLTDGDIRRFLIRGNSLEHLVIEVMSSNPVTATPATEVTELKRITEDLVIKIVPILEENRVVDVYIAELECLEHIPVVIMAGGLGSRLGSMTKDCPKPMLEVGGKPILKHILDSFLRVGFKNFYFSVNYKAEIIMDYFKNGNSENCEIKYLIENKKLGTAGSLSLLPEDVAGPIIVMNGDLLTPVDFRRLISFHKTHDSPMTLCTRNYEFQVPYGVINISNEKAISFDEKPTQQFSVNAGVYVINSQLIRKYIPKDQYFDMSTFLNVLLKEDIKASCFPMIEKWIDVGRVDDLISARGEYE